MTGPDASAGTSAGASAGTSAGNRSEVMAAPVPRAARAPIGRDVLTYVAGRTVSDLGDQIWLVALAFTAVSIGSPGLAGTVVAAGTVPRAVLMLIGGSVADQVDIRRMIMAANVARVGVLLGAVVLLSMLPTVVVLLSAAVLLGVIEAIHDPAATGYLRQLAPPEQMTRVSSLRQLGARLAVLLGAPAGGVVYGAWELPGALVVDAATFVVVLAVAWRIRPRYPRPDRARESVWRSVRSGLSYVRRTPGVARLVVSLSGLNVFVAPVTAVGVALRVHQESGSAALLGLLTGCLGAGAIVGTLVTVWWRPRAPLRTAQLVLVLQAVAIAAVGSAPVPVVVAAMAVIGLTAGVASPLLSGTFIATIDQSYVGRASALLTLADDGLVPAALVGFGLLAGAAGLGWACLVCGLGLATLMITGLLAGRRAGSARVAQARDDVVGDGQARRGRR